MTTRTARENAVTDDGTDGAAAATLSSLIPTQRAAGTDPCRCGHDRDSHEHFRAGRDCATCGRDGCARFQPAARGRALTRWLRP